MPSDEDERKHQERDVCTGLEIGCLNHGVTGIDAHHPAALFEAFRGAWLSWPHRDEFGWIEEMVMLGGQNIYSPDGKSDPTLSLLDRWPWLYTAGEAGCPWPPPRSTENIRKNEARLLRDRDIARHEWMRLAASFLRAPDLEVHFANDGPASGAAETPGF